MSIFEEQTGDHQNEEQGEQPKTPVEETPQGGEPASPKREDSQLDQMLQGITNSEGKPKYSNVQDALKSIPHAQNHIKALETDNQQLKDKIADLEQQMNEYKEQVERFASVETILSNHEETQGMSQEQLDEYFEQKLAQRESMKTAAENQKNAANSLVELFGDKEAAEKAFLDKQKELGINLAELAAQSPKAVLAYFSKEPVKKDMPDHFNGKPAGEFKPDDKPKTARLPRTTSEAKSAWRQSVEEVNSQLGIE